MMVRYLIGKLFNTLNQEDGNQSFIKKKKKKTQSARSISCIQNHAKLITSAISKLHNVKNSSGLSLRKNKYIYIKFICLNIFLGGYSYSSSCPVFIYLLNSINMYLFTPTSPNTREILLEKYVPSGRI